MKRKFILIAVFVAVFSTAVIITSCDNLGTINSLIGGMKYSIQVTNRLGGRAVEAGDTVELYIRGLEYSEDAKPRALILIADGFRDQGSKGGILYNAGWYSVEADLKVTNDVNNGPYSTFFILISYIRVKGNVYKFPNEGAHESDGKMFGTHPRWGAYGYPDNFSGITVKNSTKSIKTILTVEPEILGTPNSAGYDDQGLATDPYAYIKIEGRLNE